MHICRVLSDILKYKVIPTLCIRFKLGKAYQYQHFSHLFVTNYYQSFYQDFEMNIAILLSIVPTLYNRAPKLMFPFLLFKIYQSSSNFLCFLLCQAFGNHHYIPQVFNLNLRTEKIKIVTQHEQALNFFLCTEIKTVF